MNLTHRQLQMGEFSMEELGVFVTICATSLGGLLAVLWKSRCSKIKICCLECERAVPTPSPKKDSKKLADAPPLESEPSSSPTLEVRSPRSSAP